MHYSITQKQINYFKQHGYIEFDELLSDRQVQNLHVHLSKIGHLRSTYEAYARGRDIFRTSHDLQKIILSYKIGKVAAQLCNTLPLRIAYDQMLYTPNDIAEDSTWPPLFTGTHCLTEISSFQDLAIGLLINVHGDKPPLMFPSKPGNAVFISTSLPIDFSELFQLPNQQYLLIVYTQKSSVYIKQPLDPLTNHLKGLGYSFGDALHSDAHPIVAF